MDRDEILAEDIAHDVMYDIAAELEAEAWWGSLMDCEPDPYAGTYSEM